MLWIPHSSCSKCNMKLIQQLGEEELLFSKEKALSFNTTHIFCMKIFFIENSSYFLFLSKQGLNLISRSACFFVLKSYFVVNSLTAKPERVALSKISTSIFGFLKCIIIINNYQPICFEYYFRHLNYFLQLAAKIAVNVSFQIRFLKIQLLVIWTDIPTVLFLNKIFLAVRTVSS